eukprot:203687_1
MTMKYGSKNNLESYMYALPKLKWITRELKNATPMNTFASKQCKSLLNEVKELLISDSGSLDTDSLNTIQLILEDMSRTSQSYYFHGNASDIQNILKQTGISDIAQKWERKFFIVTVSDDDGKTFGISVPGNVKLKNIKRFIEINTIYSINEELKMQEQDTTINNNMQITVEKITTNISLVKVLRDCFHYWLPVYHESMPPAERRKYAHESRDLEEMLKDSIETMLNQIFHRDTSFTKYSNEVIFRSIAKYFQKIDPEITLKINKIGERDYENIEDISLIKKGTE